MIVVDNASTDHSIEELEKLFRSDPRLRVIRLKENVGFAQANNIGALRASGRYLVFLNNDTIVDKRWLRELIDTMERRGCALAQAKLLKFDGRRVDGAGDLIDSYGYPIILGHGDLDRSWYGCETEIFSARGAAMAVRRDVFIEIGMFDGRFFMGCEDVDLSWRARLAGHCIVLAPRAIVYHYSGYSIKRIKRLRELYIPSPGLMTMVARNFEPANMLRALPLMFLAYIYGLLRCLLLSPRSIMYNVGGFVKALKMLAHGLRTRPAVQRIRRVRDRDLTHLVFHGSLLIHLIAAGLAWRLIHKKTWPVFEEFWNTWIYRRLRRTPCPGY